MSKVHDLVTRNLKFRAGDKVRSTRSGLSGVVVKAGLRSSKVKFASRIFPGLSYITQEPNRLLK